MSFPEFEQIIAQLLSTDNNVRKQAEQHFENTKAQPDFCISSLVLIIRNSPAIEVKNLCSVLLRTSIGTGDKSLWPALSHQTQATVKAQLLEALAAEQNTNTRHQLVYVVTELGRRLFDKETVGGAQPWNELLGFMHRCTKSPNAPDRETALLIFGDLAEELKDQMRPQLAMLREVLTNGLSDPTSLKVRIAALTATCNFLQVLNEAQEMVIFQQMTPLMLETISAALQAHEEEEARSAIEIFIHISEVDPIFLRPHLELVVNAMITVSNLQDLEDETIHLALEVLVTLAESRPGMIRKRMPKFVETVLPIVVRMMLDLEDDDDWGKGNDADDDNLDITNSDIGEELLDRFSLALGPPAVVPFMFKLIPTLLSHQDWKHRHVGLMSISIMGEGCHKQMAPQLGQLIPNILNFVQDPHPRVRWCLCNTIGQMCTDFGADLPNKFHGLILPALTRLMDDTSNPRVQAHAASALINFCEEATLEIMSPYLDGLLSKLVHLLQINSTVVQEQAMTAIAAIADCVQGAFLKYYDTFMPMLKSVLTNANEKEHRRLRGKTMECITLIGGAVGKEKFAADAKQVMELMHHTQSSGLEEDDPQIGFLMQSWARVCKCLGQDFVPYLTFVMPAVIKSASINPDLQVVDDNDDDEPQEGWDFLPMGDKRVGIHTSALEEKSTACNMIFTYAQELKEGFFPFVDPVAKLMVPLLRFYYHDGVRSAAWSTLPNLLICANEYFDKQNAAQGTKEMYARNLFQFMWPVMDEGLLEEIDTEMLLVALDALAESIEASGDSLTEEQLTKLTTTLAVLFGDVKNRRIERAERQTEDDHDGEEEERIEIEAERDQEVLSMLADVIGRLFKSHQDRFLPHFSKLFPFVTQLLESTTNSDKQVGLCIFCDLVEFMGMKALNFFNSFLPLLLSSLVSPDPSLRQAAVFGAGLVAQHGGQHAAPLLNDILKGLHQAITSAEAKEELFIAPTENAISALGKLAIYQGSNVDLNLVVPFWFSCLPVTEDRVESKVTYGQLCHFIENNNPHVLGQNLANMPKILAIFGEVLDTDLIDDSVKGRMVNILKQFRSAAPSAVQTAWSTLKPEHQQTLGKYAQ